LSYSFYFSPLNETCQDWRAFSVLLEAKGQAMHSHKNWQVVCETVFHEISNLAVSIIEKSTAAQTTHFLLTYSHVRL